MPDYLARLQEEMRRPPLHRWLGPEAVRADGSEVEVRLPFRPEFAGGVEPVFVHGGIIATLCDLTGHAAAACAVGRSVPTVTLGVDYLRPAPGVDLRAVGSLRRLGRSLARVDVEIFAADKLVALSRTTFAIPEERP
ncbi:PaaI family thioesterase [Salipiger marinus]|uniref:Medium/long-chain acyl-CoA thioesterase YigI n=1 Tax=Salipiger marinus TaxID=555512 RepID=A0A1G8M5C8_9RHOB|nr:PaaI family thioesterase [Salipiger marinus]SDI63152.1 uncharacterized domain 1-containing protein [Salipiger marinus]